MSTVEELEAKCQMLLEENGELRCRVAGLAKQKCAESESFHLAILDNLNAGIWVIDKDACTTYVNPCMAEMLGYSADEMIGRRLFAFMEEKEVRTATKYLERRQQGIREEHDFEFLRKDGTRIYATLATSPLVDANQNYLGAIAGVLDVTERRRMEESLQQRGDEMASLAALGQAVNATLEPEQVISAALTSMLNALHLDTAFLFLREGEKLIQQKLLPVEARQRFDAFPDHRVGECLCGLAVREGKPMYSLDIFSDSRCTWEECKMAGMKSFAALPLLSGSEVLGAVGLASMTSRDFRPQGQFLQILTSQVSAALVNARLYESAQLEIAERKRSEDALRESEANLRKSQETGKIGSWVYRFSEEKVSWTDEMYRLFGVAAEAFAPDRDSFIDLIHPEDRSAMRAWIEACTAGEHPNELEFRRVLPDGTIRFICGRGELIHDEDGRPGYMAGTAQDITERKHAETTMLDQHAFLQSVIEGAADGLCVCREIPEYPNVEFTVWNSRMNEITGYTLEEINQHGWYQTVYPDPEVRDRAIERMSRMRTGDNMLAEEWTITRKDGTRRTVMISTSVISGHGLQPHVLALMRDVTEQKAAEDERRRLEEKMKSVQKLESLGVLAGGIAHDLNNLLMGVLGNADLAMMELSPRSPVLGFLTSIKTTAVRMAEIANQMLAYSGKGRFVVAPLNLTDLVTEMAELLHVSLRKNINLQLDLMSDLPAIAADSSQIRQVVMNLITNAADAIDKGGGVISLRTGIMSADRTSLAQFPWNQVMPEGNHIYLEVSDTGCGMTKEVMEKIFDPFFTTKTSGRGLGLAAVQGIVRGHKGSIKVYSEPGKGTIFSVLFPCSETASSPGLRQSPDIEIPNGEGKSVLVVDDEETVRTVAAAMLQKAGFKVLTAVDGVEALSILRAHGTEIDVVLLDMTMPKMNGIETFSEIRRITADLPVILCSGYNEQDATEHFSGKGLAEFIKKPYDVHTLTEKVAEVIARGATHDDSGQG